MSKVYWTLITVVVLLAVSVVADGPLNGGDPNCDQSTNVSDLTYLVNYLFKGGAAPCDLGALSSPVAAGVVNSDASLSGNTGNFGCTWNASLQRYEIIIAGENYHFMSWVTHVTPVGTSSLTATAASAGGVLVIYLFDSSGNRTAGTFQFSSYKL